MAQPLIDLVEQFCTFQRKQRGKTEGGVKTYRWNLCQFLEFVRGRRGRPACVGDLEPATIQAWMDSMAAADLALSTMRVRQSTLSSLCSFLVKRGHLETNPVARLDRPPHRRDAPRQVPGSAIMDALVAAARQRQSPRDLAIFLVLRYSGMRRESVATLRVRNLDCAWGLRNVPVKGGKTRDIPLPAAVSQYLNRYVSDYLPSQVDGVTPDTPLFSSTFGQRRQGLVRWPMEGKNIWRLCKTYGRRIGYPMLKPHDLRHGVAMEVYEQHRDLEQVRGLLGHRSIETTQLYAQIRPTALKHAVEFYESKALDALSS
jgi:site-specific recombinase XerD